MSSKRAIAVNFFHKKGALKGKVILGILLLSFSALGCYESDTNNTNNTNDIETMESEKEIVIEGAEGKVAQIDTRNGLLHGYCKWYTVQGELIADGVFDNGSPIDGTFLNWANFYDDFDQDNPFAMDKYCQDYISMFEMSFRSVAPKYDMILETYKGGIKVPTP